MSDREDIKQLEDAIRKLQERLNALAEENSFPEELDEGGYEVAESSEKLDEEKKDDSPEEEEQEPVKIDKGATEEDVDEDAFSRRKWRHERPYKGGIDFGDRLGEYISGFVEDIMEGVSIELEKSLFQDKWPRRMRHRTPIDAKATADVMSALGNEHRITILNEMSYGGLYASDINEALPDSSPSTLSSHLDVLEEAGLIYQEKRRGRYLITIPGRIAVNMAYRIAERIKS